MPGAASSTCSNPRCRCTPCACTGECRCGTPRLGELERRVMDVLWANAGAELTGRDVANELPEYAYTTIATVLDRLARKGEVRRAQHGSQLSFSATGPGSAHTARVLRDALDTSDDPAAALRAFAATLDPDEAGALGAALARRVTDAPKDGSTTPLR